MARLLIAFASNEGQTAKIADALARQLGAVGHDVRTVALGDPLPFTCL